MSSRLGDNLQSSISKGGSLQNIPAQFNSTSSDDNKSNSTAAAANTSNTVVSTTNTTTTSTSNSSSSSGSSGSGIRRGPTHRALQRRERKDRPKTMYAGRAETTNLVNLITKFQEEEKKKGEAKTNGKTNGVPSPAAHTTTFERLNSTPASSFSSSSFSSSSSSSSSSRSTTIKPTPVPAAASTSIPAPVTLRHSSGTSARERHARPTSYCSTSSDNFKQVQSNNSSSSSNSNSNNKPPPHERMLQRSRTVAGGMGAAKQSKKAMLLRWCQYVTQDYENVKISDFAESFSNGLAFCAMMHHFLPDEIPFSTLKPTNRESNFKLAFQAAEGVGIPSLLDVEDMVILPKPDWMSVMTYVSFIYNKFGQQNQQQNQSSMV